MEFAFFAGHAVCGAGGVVSAVYRRRAPETTLLHRVVRENLNTFLEFADSRSPEGKRLPRYVRNAFRRFLDCGILARGFARVRCPRCGHDTVVAFSCKERGICPSCAGRRMADEAARLVDNVLPPVPVRQWVLSFPRVLRYILARDAKLLSQARRIWVSEVFRDIRRRAGIRRAGDGLCGAVTATQRFGGALNLNIHFHTLVLEGLYVGGSSGEPLRFRRLRAPGEGDLRRVLSRVRKRVLRFLERMGYAVFSRPEEESEAAEEPSVFEVVQAASIRGWIGLSDVPQRVPLLRGEKGASPARPKRKRSCAMSSDGWSLQAGVRLGPGDRDGVERLCRYLLRPPFAEERLSELPDGRILYRFRRPRFDGSRYLVLTPVQFLEKLAALVPPPRSHLVCYHGVLAPHARSRRRVVPCPDGWEVEAAESCPPGSCRAGHGWGSDRGPQADPAPASDGCHRRWEGEAAGRRRGSPVGVGDSDGPSCRRVGRRSRTPWAELMRRSMGLDVLTCPRCGGRMDLIACITEPEVIRKVLGAMGLPVDVPVVAPPRPPPQAEFEFVQISG